VGTSALIEGLLPLVGTRTSRAEEFAMIKAQSRKEFESVRPQVATWM